MRLPGKKVRIEQFKLKNSMVVDVELRLTNKGEFYMEVDGVGYREKTLEDVREQVMEVLNRTRTLTYRPVIWVHYEAAGGTGQHWRSNHEVDRVEIHLDFDAGWVSEQDAGNGYRWVRVEIAPNARELPQPDLTGDWRRVDTLRTEDLAELIPFTPERWATLHRIHAGIGALRDRIADLMADASGAKLDAIPPGPLMLEAPKPRKKP